jgi:flagellar biosynthesis protein
MKKKAAAIKYLKENLDVPVISALGYGDLADKIIKEAKDNGIKIIENKYFFNFEDLFQLNENIPEEVYKIVIDILVFIMKTNDIKMEKV